MLDGGDGLGSIGFQPDTIRPSAKPLTPLRALNAAMRNTLELFDDQLFDLPSRQFHWMGRKFVEIMDPALIEGVFLTQVDAFRKSPIQQRFVRPAFGEGILIVEGEQWRAQRRAAAAAFTPAAIDALKPHFMDAGRHAADRLASSARANGAVDVGPHMNRATFDIISRVLLSEDGGALDFARVTDALDAYAATIGRANWFDIIGAFEWRGRPLGARGEKAVAELRRVAEEAIAKTSKAKSAPSLVARLANADFEGAELRDLFINFLIAGNETTALSLCWALHLIASDPVVQQRLAREIEAVASGRDLRGDDLERLILHQNVLKEAMRLYPPVAMLQRQATRPIKIGDIEFAKGDEAVCLFYVMHRSRLLWDHPETFDPDRFAPPRAAGRHRFAHAPFGAGPHICIGMRLAMLEMTAILASLVRRFALTPAQAKPRPLARVTLRSENGFWIHLNERARTTTSCNGPRLARVLRSDWRKRGPRDRNNPHLRSGRPLPPARFPLD